MIKNIEPLSMPEVVDYVKNSETESEIIGFVKKFNKLKIEEVGELKQKLIDLNFLKLKIDKIIKIVDLMPSDSESLNKIFTDVSLDENESKKILEIIKEFE